MKNKISEEDLNYLANKIADILWSRYEKEQEKMAEIKASSLWDTPANIRDIKLPNDK